MSISCHFRDCKALLVTSLTHVSGAIASVQTFTFTFTAGSKRWSLLMTGDDDEMFITRSLNVTPKTTKQHLTVQ